MRLSMNNTALNFGRKTMYLTTDLHSRGREEAGTLSAIDSAINARATRERERVML